MSIYVEILIRAPLDEIWRHTQTPELHERWDLRFTEISYLPRPNPAEPQRFRYATRIGFGMEIRGEGESVGSHTDAQGVGTSALRFRSDDPRSLIREGSGYWQYLPTEAGVRFLTLYDYRTRFGALGWVVDRLLFRPLLSWATAWSFDRLRLWLERGIDPAVALERTLVYGVARLCLAFIWIYHGLVPKLLVHDADELAILARPGVFAGFEATALTAVGVGEIAFGLAILVAWRSRPLLWLNVVVLVALTLGTLVTDPSLVTRAFNPLTFNLAVLALATVGLLVGHDLPSARHTMRVRPRRTAADAATSHDVDLPARARP